MKLLRVLGIAFGIAVTLGGTLGVGILRTPGMVAREAGSTWLTMAIWLGGGLFALFATVSIAELGVMIPKAGGFYNYARAAWGDAAGFAVGWCDCLGQASAVAYGAVTAQDLLAKLGYAAPGAAVLLILLIAVVQWLGIRSASRVQQGISFVLCFGYLALAVAALIAERPATGTTAISASAGLAGIAIAFRAVIVTYDGWYGPVYFAEEVKDTARDLPRSMVRGVLLVTAVYLLLNAAFLAVLGVGGLSRSSFPALDVAERLWGESGGRVITVISLLAMPSLMNAVTLFCTRIVYAMSRDGLAPRALARVNPRGTPDAALAATIAFALVLAVSGTWDRLLALAGFLFAVLYSSGFLALLVLRNRRPHAQLPFRAWLYPWGTLAVLTCCVVFLATDSIANPRDAAASVVLLAVSYPVYLLSRRWSGESQPVLSR